MNHHIEAIDKMIANAEKTIAELKALRLFFTLAFDQEADQPHHFITATVANEFGLTIDRLTGRDRRTVIHRPRYLAAYLIREYTEMTLHQVGEHFGDRDHASIIRGVEKVPDLRRLYPAFDASAAKIIEVLDVHFERV